MANLNLTSIEQNLEKSGFLLEHQVTEKLMKNGWNVINNRYYIDDVQEIAREIDLIAYKVAPIRIPNAKKEINLFTTLIISCKKSEKNIWTMLFRDVDKKNPNMDWFPFKNWSNQKVIKYLINHQDWKADYIKAAEDAGIYTDLFESTGHLFAYQEMDKAKFTVQNQPNIFNAVSSLMKAESYEMSSLERRKKDSAIYNFNLISVVDSELVKVHCKGKNTIASEVDETKAIFNYIVNKKETASRIHFFTFNAIEKFLNSYNQLHTLNKVFFSEQIHTFYNDIFSDLKRVNVLKDEFSKTVLPYINYHCKVTLNWESSFEKLDFFRSSDGGIKIALPKSTDIIEEINAHSGIQRVVSNNLKKIFVYTDDFTFIDDEDIPF